MPEECLGKGAASPAIGALATGDDLPVKLKTASEHRKSSKPVMEKRRRARINDSLNQLKSLMLDALKKDTSRHSKLEKADILEMTVKHLQSVQHAHVAGTLTEPAILGRYRAGYSACAAEVGRFVSSCEGVALPVRTRLLAHLADRVVSLPGQRLSDADHGRAELQMFPSGIQLLPSSGGHLAVLIPTKSNFSGTQIIPLYGAGGTSPSTPPAVQSESASHSLHEHTAVTHKIPLCCSASPPCLPEPVWRPW
uniref:transcription factor HES-4-B-like isoform X2 n=1 Tax=Myxine glutinosa TaxID=7769 RepID=UPI00358E3FE6